MPGVISVSHAGALVSVAPEPGPGVEDAKQFLLRAGFPLDRSIGRYTLRVQDFPAFVGSADMAGLELQPVTTLASWLRETAAEYRRVQGFIDTIGRDLFPFQHEGVAFLWRGRERLLFDQMGLGKTPQALCAIEPGQPAIAIVPKGLLATWADECKRWRPDIAVHIVRSSKQFRWPQRGELVISSYGTIPADLDQHGQPLTGTVALGDEGQAVKNWSAQRTQAFRKLYRRIRKADGFRWILTGTPLMNNPPELWAMLQALEIGSRLYGNYKRFVQLFGGAVDGLGQIEWNPSAVHPTAMDPIKPYALRRNRADVLPELPPKMRRTIIVPPPKDTKQMDWVWKTHANSIDELVLHLGDDPGMMGDRKQLAAHKIPAMLELVEQYESEGEPLVVFSAHRAPVEALAGRQGWGSIMGGSADRPGTVERFQAGELKGLACTIRAAGVGLTLTRSAHTLFVDREWNPALNIQAEDRVYRISQTRGVLVTDLVCDHPLDRALTQLLTEKMDYHDATIAKLETPFQPRDRNREAEQLESLAHEIETAAA